MCAFTMIVEQDTVTGYYVGTIPGWPGAHTQAESLDELRLNMQEVIELLLEDGEPPFVSEFIGTQLVATP